MNNSDSAVTALAAVDRTPATGFVRAPCQGSARGGFSHHGLSPRISIVFSPKGLMCLVAVALVSLMMMILAISAGFIITHQDWTEIFSNVPDAWSALGGLAYTWLPEHAFAESIPYKLKLTIAGGISDRDGSGLTDARVLTTFESDGRTYAVVAGYDDVYILDLSDPYNIMPAGRITDDDNLNLANPKDISTFESDGRAYVVVAGYDDVQILDLSDPYNIIPAGRIADDGNLYLRGTDGISTFESGDRTYAAVTGDDGVQILNLSDPYNITPAGRITDDDNIYPGGTEGISTFESGDRTYAAVVQRDGVQILDLSDPYNIIPAGRIVDDDSTYLDHMEDISTFESGDRTYAVGAGYEGVQILDLSDPYNITPAGRIVDDDSTYLDYVRSISTFESDGRIYAAVGSYYDHSVQILNLSDPYNITPAGRITDDDSTYLDYVADISTFESDGRTYAAVIPSGYYNIVQILDLTDPYSIIPTSGITVTADIVYLYGASDISTFRSDGRTYATVASAGDNGVQILNLTNPYNITAADGIPDIRGARQATMFESDGRTYAVIVQRDGVQILDLSDPYNIAAMDIITDDGNLALKDVMDITTFESDGRTYAAVVRHDGIQILDLSDPYSITAADDTTNIRGARQATMFKSDGHTYAAVVQHDGVQILDLSDPYSITAADDTTNIRGASQATVFKSDGHTYAAVLSVSNYNYGVQILDLTNPYNITLAGHVLAGGYPTDIEMLELDGHTYAAVALNHGGIHTFNLTDPYKMPLPVSGTISHGGLHQITSITTFNLDGRTYMAATTPYEGVKTLHPVAEPDACAVYTADDATTPVIPPEIATANNRFAVDLYRQISEGGGNVFFSPISVYTAFSMVGEGARGETASQLQDALGFEPDEELRHNSTAMLMSSLNQQDPCATLHIANSLWIANWFEPYDSYVDVIDDTYMADIGSVDFSEAGKEKTAGLINGWVADKTEDKIPSVLRPDDISNETSSILINAIYFKGSWEQPFKLEYTIKDDFWTGTQNVIVDFMQTKNRFGYAGYDEVQVLRMPYDGDRLSMVIILPSDRDGLDNLMDSVTAEQISTWLEGMRSVEVVVQIPKFEVRTNYNLIQPLMSMGVIDVFDDRTSDLSGMVNLKPDLSGMANLEPDLSGTVQLEPRQIVAWIEKAAQSAYVKVNEEGTEAAAVTAISSGAISTSIPPPPILFIADHPFLFLIQDDKSGTILFMGRMSDPSIQGASLTGTT